MLVACNYYKSDLSILIRLVWGISAWGKWEEIPYLHWNSVYINPTFEAMAFGFLLCSVHHIFSYTNLILQYKLQVCSSVVARISHRKEPSGLGPIRSGFRWWLNLAKSHVLRFLLFLINQAATILWKNVTEVCNGEVRNYTVIICFV